MKSELIVITGHGIPIAGARHIPSSVTDPVFITDSYTRERILLAKQKSTQQIWLFHENEEGWTPWRPLSTAEVSHYYDCAPRLHLATAEYKVIKASA